MKKCMKHENKWKKEGQKGLTGLRGQKPLKKFEGKRQNDKNSDLKSWPIEEREKSVLKKFESDWTCENSKF